MKKLLVLASALGVLAIMAAKPANADVNTFNATGYGLAAGAIDPNYAYTTVDFANTINFDGGYASNQADWTDVINAAKLAASSTDTKWNKTYVTDLTAYPGASTGTYNWDANTSPAKWISPQTKYTEGSITDAPGYYLYKTSVTFANNVDFAQASVNGKWLSDNQGISIFFSREGGFGDAGLTYDNGTDAGAGGPGWTSLKQNELKNFDFTISGLTNKTTDIYFLVHNGTDSNINNPTGLVAKADVYAPAVPEPAFVQLGVLLSSGGFMFLRKRRA